MITRNHHEQLCAPAPYDFTKTIYAPHKELVIISFNRIAMREKRIYIVEFFIKFMICSRLSIFGFKTFIV